MILDSDSVEQSIPVAFGDGQLFYAHLVRLQEVGTADVDRLAVVHVTKDFFGEGDANVLVENVFDGAVDGAFAATDVAHHVAVSCRDGHFAGPAMGQNEPNEC